METNARSDISSAEKDNSSISFFLVSCQTDHNNKIYQICSALILTKNKFLVTVKLNAFLSQRDPVKKKERAEHPKKTDNNRAGKSEERSVPDEADENGEVPLIVQVLLCNMYTGLYLCKKRPLFVF